MSALSITLDDQSTSSDKTFITRETPDQSLSFSFNMFGCCLGREDEIDPMDCFLLDCLVFASKFTDVSPVRAKKRKRRVKSSISERTKESEREREKKIGLTLRYSNQSGLFLQ